MPQDDYEDDLSTKLKMHTITSNTIGNENEENSEPQVIGEDEEYNLAQDPILNNFLNLSMINFYQNSILNLQIVIYQHY